MALYHCCHLYGKSPRWGHFIHKRTWLALSLENFQKYQSYNCAYQLLNREAKVSKVSWNNVSKFVAIIIHRFEPMTIKQQADIWPHWSKILSTMNTDNWSYQPCLKVETWLVVHVADKTKHPLIFSLKQHSFHRCSKLYYNKSE